MGIWQVAEVKINHIALYRAVLENSLQWMDVRKSIPDLTVLLFDVCLTLWQVVESTYKL